MTPLAPPPTPFFVGTPSPLIPSETAVHLRLVAVCREARLLRRLLRLAREAATVSTNPSATPAPGTEVGRVN